MKQNSTIRVAVAQCAAGNDPQQNLQTCLRLLDKAAECRPDLVVLPEFCNHLSWYDDQQHCYDVSADLEGEFIESISGKVAELGFHAVVNVTLRQAEPAVSGTSVLFSPAGEIIATNDKQVLIGHENQFLTPASQSSPIVETPLGQLGLYACMDGVINETPRCLALRGAQVLCNSLNSFASDEASLHIPVRAAENRVFVAAANKVGPLIPEEILGPVSEATGIPEAFLHGAGESQIVAPDGEVLAMASRDREEVVWADIEPSRADDKRLGDGTDAFAARRPELYSSIGEDPAGQQEVEWLGQAPVPVAVLEPSSCGAEALQSVCERVKQLGRDEAALIVLPELVAHEAVSAQDLSAAAALDEHAIKQLSAACADGQYVATSVVTSVQDGFALSAVLVGVEGVVLRQGLIHPCAAYPWSLTEDGVHALELPFGRVGLLAGPDSRFPEAFRLLALEGVELAGVPLAAYETWELQTGLVERAAENRINLMVANRPEAIGHGFVADLQTDFTVLTPWKERAFDGVLSCPNLHHSPGGGALLRAIVHPANASNKVVSMGTDLLSGRPWRLVDAITRT